MPKKSKSKKSGGKKKTKKKKGGSSKASKAQINPPNRPPMPSVFPKSRYKPLSGPSDKFHVHVAAYSFIVVILTIFILGLQFGAFGGQYVEVGKAYSGDPDIDEDHCLYYLNQLDGCSAYCYNLPYDVEVLSASYNPKCCGDDALEHAGYFQVYSVGDDVRNEFSIGLDDIMADAACCRFASECVYHTKCYADGSVLDIDGDGVKGEVCKEGKWADLDAFEGLCIGQSGMYWATSGENRAFGEFDSALSGPECCGDDAGEYRKGGVYCCNDPTDVVDGRRCI